MPDDNRTVTRDDLDAIESVSELDSVEEVAAVVPQEEEKEEPTPVVLPMAPRTAPPPCRAAPPPRRPRATAPRRQASALSSAAPPCREAHPPLQLPFSLTPVRGARLRLPPSSCWSAGRRDRPTILLTGTS